MDSEALETERALPDFEERFEELSQMADEKKYRAVRDILAEWPEVDIAYFLEELTPEKAVLVFRMLPKELAADIFANLDGDSQK